MVITLRAQIELRFALRRTVSEIQAVEIQLSDNRGFSPFIAQGAQNGFLPNDNHPLAQIELRFTLRPTVSEIFAVVVFP